MRLAMTIGTIGFLYRFGQTMIYLESEKHEETPQLKADRRAKERRQRQELTREAMQASRIVPPSEEHVRAVIERANIR